MATWTEIEAAVPDLAREVRARFTAAKHSTMATVRRDGAPRISGTEVEFSGGELWIGSMPRAVKALDLLRDGRLALHSPTAEPGAEGTSWAGEAKVAGVAVEVPREGDDSHRFRLDLHEVVLTRLGEPPDHLVIESWHPDRGYVRRERR